MPTVLTLLLGALLQSFVIGDTLPSNFYLDIDGISVSVGDDYMCVLEQQPGVELGGKAYCWSRHPQYSSVRIDTVLSRFNSILTPVFIAF